MARRFAASMLTMILAVVALALAGCGGSGGGSSSVSNPNSSSPPAPAQPSSPAPPTSPSPPVNSSGNPLSGVWIHDEPTVVLGDPYGNQQSPSGALANLQAIKAVNITAVAADCFTNPSVLNDDFAAAQAVGLEIAPEVDLSVLYQNGAAQADMQTAEENTIADYVSQFGSNPAAARTPSGQLIIWIFGTHQLTTANWQSVIAQVQSAEPNVYLIGDLSGSNPGFNAQWSFFPGSTPIITSLMPQYTHPNSSTYLAPDGGARYTQQWQSAMADQAPAITIESWDSLTDGSEIDDNSTYQSETAQYAAQYEASMAVAIRNRRKG
jgi:hypothetical protein